MHFYRDFLPPMRRIWPVEAFKIKSSK